MTEVIALKPHISINVRDIRKSLAFYRTMLGVDASKIRTGYAKFDLHNPNLNLALNEVPSLAGPGALSHLGIQVATTDDVVSLRDRWLAAGLITKDEMQTDCCYATQDKTWVMDPDGNRWEAFVVVKDNLPENVGRSTCCSSAQSEPATACGTSKS